MHTHVRAFWNEPDSRGRECYAISLQSCTFVYSFAKCLSLMPNLPRTACTCTHVP